MADRRRADIPWRTEDTAQALHDRYRRERNPLVKVRLHALWLLRQDRTLQEVVTLVGVAYRSLQRWLEWYRQDGLATVCQHTGRSPGRERWLAPEQEAALCAHLAEGSTFAAADVQAYLATTYGVTYTLGSIYTVLARLHCRPKMPRPHNPQSTDADQDAWKKGGAAVLSPPRG
jgi:transposase